jgi:hypothetical protein
MVAALIMGAAIEPRPVFVNLFGGSKQRNFQAGMPARF